MNLKNDGSYIERIEWNNGRNISLKNNYAIDNAEIHALVRTLINEIKERNS